MKESGKNFLEDGPKIRVQSNQGFTLIEVIIAITIFAVFLSAYVVSQGQNLADSTRMQDEILLRKLSEDIINEAILSPPEYSPSLGLSTETKKFENDEYADYEYKVEYKQIEIPNLAEITGSDQSEASENAKSSAIQSKIFDQFKDNIEKMIWQLSVTVTNKQTGYSYIISTWVKDKKAVPKITL